jgi:hypothetical protein
MLNADNMKCCSDEHLLRYILHTHTELSYYNMIYASATTGVKLPMMVIEALPAAAEVVMKKRRVRSHLKFH